MTPEDDVRRAEVRRAEAFVENWQDSVVGGAPPEGWQHEEAHRDLQMLADAVAALIRDVRAEGETALQAEKTRGVMLSAGWKEMARQRQQAEAMYQAEQARSIEYAAAARQAEAEVARLTTANEILRDGSLTNTRMVWLEAEAARRRAALEWYARGCKSVQTDEHDKGKHLASPDDHCPFCDNGERARAALAARPEAQP